MAAYLSPYSQAYFTRPCDRCRYTDFGRDDDRSYIADGIAQGRLIYICCRLSVSTGRADDQVDGWSGGDYQVDGTVVPECFKDDNKSQWKSMENWEIWPLTVPKTAETMATKFGVGDDVGDTYCCAKFHYNPIKGFLLLTPACPGTYKVTLLVFLGVLATQHREAPLHRFSRSIRHMTSFHARLCILGVSKTKFHIFDPISPPQNANFWPIFWRDLENFASKRP